MLNAISREAGINATDPARSNKGSIDKTYDRDYKPDDREFSRIYHPTTDDADPATGHFEILMATGHAGSEMSATCTIRQDTEGPPQLSKCSATLKLFDMRKKSSTSAIVSEITLDFIDIARFVIEAQLSIEEESMKRCATVLATCGDQTLNDVAQDRCFQSDHADFRIAKDQLEIHQNRCATLRDAYYILTKDSHHT